MTDALTVPEEQEIPGQGMAYAASPPELYNIAQDLDEKELTEIAETAITDAEEDDKSRDDWMRMHADWISLYFQTDAPKSPPWNNSSTESMPIVAEACNQFHSRAFRAFFPNRDIVKAVPVGMVDEIATNRAERVGKHMSWQLMVKDKRYKRDKDALLLSAALHGSYFTKTYYDPVKRRNCVQNVRAEDLIVPYGVGPRDLEDIERKTHVCWMSVNDTRILQTKGYFLSSAEPWQDSSATPTQDASDKSTGVQNNSIRRTDSPAKIYEQHRLLDLDGDGVEEPYIVTVDCQSKKVLRITVRYEVDETGEPVGDKDPIEYFTHYQFLPNPDGFYGLGMGHLVGRINTAVNKMLRQTIDAGTLANVGNASGFIADTLAIKGGDMEFQLGKFAKIPASADDLQKGIYTFKFPGPNPVVFEVIRALTERADRLATVTEAITGQTDKVMQPTTILALIEQSQQVFSTIYERLFDAWECELRKIYRLNRKYLDTREYFAVLDANGPQQMEIAKADYAEDFQIVPITDPKMATEQQKLAKAEAAFAFLSQNPLTLQNPRAFYIASKRYGEAIGIEDIDQVLPSPPSADPMQVDDPRMENMAALTPAGQIPPVFPEQEHMNHIKQHEAFLSRSPYSRMITPAGAQGMAAHIQMHYALMYGDLETPMQAMQAGIPLEHMNPIEEQQTQLESIIQMLSQVQGAVTQPKPRSFAFQRGEDGKVMGATELP